MLASAATNVALGFSGFAALLGIASLGWNILSWWLPRRRDLRVTASVGADGPGEEIQVIIIVHAGNRSERPLPVGNFGLLTQDDPRIPYPFVAEHSPRSIDPRDAGMVSRTVQELESFDFTRPVVPFVRLRTGEVVTPMIEVMEKIAQRHNEPDSSGSPAGSQAPD